MAQNDDELEAIWPNEADQDEFICVNQYRHLCSDRAILAMYRNDVITLREAEFLLDIGHWSMISPLQEEWLINIESRHLQHEAHHGTDDNDLVERLVPRNTHFTPWNPKS